MDEHKLDIEISISDAILDKPICFNIGKRRFYLYQPTLGKTYLLARITESLELNNDILSMNPYMEALRLCKEKRDTVCLVIAYHSLQGKRNVLDNEKVNKRAKLFSSQLDDAELAQLLVLVFSWDSSESYIKHFGIDKERALQKRISSVKSNKGSISFGGKSIYGLLIDTACQRYGWTFDYVVWGISYINLQMLLADSVSSVYLSDEERKKLNIRDGGEVINADDPKNLKLIKSMNWD